MSDRVEPVDLSEAVPSWAAWLAAFDRDVWPLFARHGISKDAALIAFNVNAVANAVAALGGDDHGDDWRKEP